MLIKKEKIEDLEFMDVEPEDEELRSIVMEEEDKALSWMTAFLWTESIPNRLTDKQPYVVIEINEA